MSLPELAALGLEVFVFPIVGSLWMKPMTAAAITYFWFIVRVGASLSHPLELISEFSGQFERAATYYFLWFPLLILLGVFIGWLIKMLMDIRDVIGFDRLFPSFRTHHLDNVVSTPCDPIDLVKLRDYLCHCDKGIVAHCFTHIEPNYWHIFVGVVLVIITLFLPHFLFWLLVTRSKWLAFIVTLALIALGYFLAWFYWSYWTDLATWGPTEYNMAARLEAIRKDPDNSVYAEDPDITSFAPALYAETQSVINKNVLIMALIHLFGVLLIGGLIVIPTTANLTVVTIVGLIFLLAIAFIVALIAFIAFSKTGLRPSCPRYCPRTGVLLSNSIRLASSLTNDETSAKKKQIVPYVKPKLGRGRSLLDAL